MSRKVQRIKGTIVPSAFKRLWRKLLKLPASIEHGETTVVFKRDERILFTIRRQGSNSDYIKVFLNSTSEKKPRLKDYSGLQWDRSPRGEIRIIILVRKQNLGARFLKDYFNDKNSLLRG